MSVASARLHAFSTMRARYGRMLSFVPRVLAFAGLCALAACNAATPPAPVARAPAAAPAMYRSLAAQDARVDVEAAREMISLYRSNKGRDPLTIDPDLQGVAQAQAQDMARRADLDARGALTGRLKDRGVTALAAAENVSAGYHTLAEAFSGWRDSAPHNARMLDSRMRRMGLATAYAPGAKYKVYWALVLTD